MKARFCQHLLQIGAYFALALLLMACLSTVEKPTSVTPISPSLLPNFLKNVFPKQGVILSVDDYAGGICIEIYACGLLSEGDFWEFDDVYERTTILVDNQLAGRLIGDGLVIPMGCSIGDSENVLAQTSAYYNWCVSAPLEAGVHQVDTSFEKSNGETVSFAWTFELVDGPAPTSTPLPTPSEIDRVGLLPDYIEATYPLVGEEVLPPPDVEGWSNLLENRGMPAARLTSPSMQPVCVALVYSELLKLGTLPGGDHFYDHIYLAVDDRSHGDWLYPVSGHPTPGWTVSQCIETTLALGEHVAILYVDLFDADLVVYSWAFTVEEH